MFQFPGFPSAHYVFMYRYTDITLYEFPHSEIFGLKVACTSPKLIAAYHVLHRLPAPRHSPYALYNLTFSLLLLAANHRVIFCPCSVEYVMYTPSPVQKAALCFLQLAHAYCFYIN